MPGPRRINWSTRERISYLSRRSRRLLPAGALDNRRLGSRSLSGQVSGRRSALTSSAAPKDAPGLAYNERFGCRPLSPGGGLDARGDRIDQGPNDQVEP